MECRNQSAIIISLPKEIIEEEILSRLPVKPLLRFGCVSKRWGSLIDSNRFIKTQYQNSIQNPSFPQQRVICHKTGLWLELSSLQPLLNEPPYIYNPTYTSPVVMPLQVSGCYNGLVCILKAPTNFFLWNPSTRISKKLPDIANCALVCCSSFGWVESSGEYKVVALMYGWDSGKGAWAGKVYSSKRKSWKRIEPSMDLSLSCEAGGVFVGGKLHWEMNKGDGDIVFLDLKTELFGRIELPFDEEAWHNKRLGEIGGCLCVLYHNLDLDYGRRNIRVWVMKESWERIVDLPHLLELPERPFFAPFTIDPKGEIFLVYGSTFLVYDPRDNVFSLPKACGRYNSHYVYVESLVSPEDV